MSDPVRFRRRPAALAAAAVLALAGCDVLPQPQADNVRYFTLSEPPAAVAPGGVTVHPVQLAGHLRNRAMAVRVAAHEITYLDDVQWAEAPADAVTQLLRNRLAAVEGEAYVSVRVQRLELVRSDANAVEMAATYEIDRHGAPPLRGVFTARPRTWDGKDYGVLVGFLHDEVCELGDALAAALSEKK